MSGLLAALQHNAQALNVHSKSLEITGKNLANVNNPAYARQRVLVGTLGSIQTTLGVQSMGISALALQHQRDALMDNQVQRDISRTATLESRRDSLLGVNAALDDRIIRSDDAANIGSLSDQTGGGLSQLISSFFNAWESFATRPDSAAEKTLLIEKAQALAARINDADSRLQDVQGDLTNRMTDQTAEVNRILDHIAELNTRIAQAEIATNKKAIDLRDERQANIEKLAKYINFQATEQPNGMVHITASPSVDLVNSSGVQGVFAFTGTSFTGGIPVTTLNLTEGSLQSLLNVRDTEIGDGTTPGYRKNLRDLANDLRTTINGGTYYNGNFFAPGSGLPLTVAETPATVRAHPPGVFPPGENSVALNIASLINTPRPSLGNITYSEHVGQMVAKLGLDINLTSNRLTDQQLAERLTRENRDSISGVSQDEELTNMIRFQRTFQASARVTNVLDDLLDLVANRLGRLA